MTVVATGGANGEESSLTTASNGTACFWTRMSNFSGVQDGRGRENALLKAKQQGFDKDKVWQYEKDAKTGQTQKVEVPLDYKLWAYYEYVSSG